MFIFYIRVIWGIGVGKRVLVDIIRRDGLSENDGKCADPGDILEAVQDPRKVSLHPEEVILMLYRQKTA